MTVEAFSPCNITGFFEIVDGDFDPLRVGSKGASVALRRGVTTRVSLRKRHRSRVDATFNGKRLSGESVSVHLAQRYLRLDGRDWHVDIHHASSLPFGRGYGTSGAGAMGLSLALNDALGLSFDKLEAAQVAHISEVACKTGLGTVSSIYYGGMTLRTSPGAPGMGRVERVPISESERLVTTSLGPIPTRRILRNSTLRDRINSCGKDLVYQLQRKYTYPSFIEFSRSFALCLDLMPSKLVRLMNALERLGIESSMAMLGQTLFSIVRRDEVGRVEAEIRSQGSIPVVTRITNSGARLL